MNNFINSGLSLDYMADVKVNGYSIIEKTYIIEFEGRKFRIGAGDLAARLSDASADFDGIGKALRGTGFSVSELYDDQTRILKPGNFGDNSHYYHLIAVLTKRGAFKEFEQSQLPAKVKD